MKKIIIVSLAFLLITSSAAAFTVSGRPAPGGVGCTPTYGSELATGANATDDEGGNETDATTGWTSTGLATFDSIDTAPYAGTYHMTAVADSAGDAIYRVLSLSASTMYRMDAYIRHNGTASANGEWRCYVSGTTSGFDTFLTPTLVKTDTTYTLYTKYFYYNARMDNIQCQERNAANDGGVYIDSFSIKAVTSPCLGSELYTTANAISTTNEANGVTGISVTGSPTISSTASDPGDGTYSMLFETAADGNNWYIDLSTLMTNGNKYFVSFKYKVVSGDTLECTFDTDTALVAVSDTNERIVTSSADTSWIHYGISIVYDANHRYFGCREAGSNNNAVFQIDALSIKEITAE